MTYVNSGYQRATSLKVNVYVEGVLQNTVTLPLMEAFGEFAAIPGSTEIEQKDYVAKMSIEDYNTRTTAYAAYVQANYQSQYPGLEVTNAGARVYNDTACPLP